MKPKERWYRSSAVTGDEDYTIHPADVSKWYAGDDPHDDNYFFHAETFVFWFIELSVTHDEITKLIKDFKWAKEQYEQGLMNASQFQDFLYENDREEDGVRPQHVKISAERRSLDTHIQGMILIANPTWSHYEKWVFCAANQRYWGILKLQPPLFPFSNVQKAIEETMGRSGQVDTSIISTSKIIKMAKNFNQTHDMSISQTTQKMCRLFTLADTYNKFCKNLTCRVLYVPKTIGFQQEAARCFSKFDNEIWPKMRKKQANILTVRRGGGAVDLPVTASDMVCRNV